MHYWRMSNIGYLADTMVVLVGIAFVLGGSRYEFGTLRHMGPGFFPVCLGCLVAAFGAFELVRTFRDRGEQERLQWQPVLLILLALFSFGVLATKYGLLPATATLIVISAFAEKPVRIIEIVGLIIVLSLLGYFLFGYLLHVPLQIIGF